MKKYTFVGYLTTEPTQEIEIAVSADNEAEARERAEKAIVGIVGVVVEELVCVDIKSF